MRVQARLKPCTRNHPKIQEQVLETPQRRDCPLLGEQTVIIIISWWSFNVVLIDCPLLGEKTVIKIIICWGWVVFYWAKEWAQRSSKDLVSVSRRVPAGWSLGKFQAAHCGGNPTPATPGGFVQINWIMRAEGGIMCSCHTCVKKIKEWCHLKETRPCSQSARHPSTNSHRLQAPRPPDRRLWLSLT